MKFLALLLISPLVAQAAVNEPCIGSGGRAGVCVTTTTCDSSGGITVNGACPADAANVKCCTKNPCGSGGNCRWTSGTYPALLIYAHDLFAHNIPDQTVQVHRLPINAPVRRSLNVARLPLKAGEAMPLQQFRLLAHAKQLLLTVQRRSSLLSQGASKALGAYETVLALEQAIIAAVKQRI